ncbi:MAG: class I tRNA ligase family protein [Firmicutes bacterium]|nr:class I tRNA ligase family protein [Bacillota bacterium]
MATNSRGGGVIEPQIKEQWFMDVNREFPMKHSEIAGIKEDQMVTLKQLMRHVVQEGLIKIIPEHFEKIYFHWIDNLRDWCISRQIWYGHRIPVWYKTNLSADLSAPPLKREEKDL